MAKEIERKFLLAKGTSIPLPAKLEQTSIKQGYIFLEKGKHLRIRIYQKLKAFICLKYTSGPIRDEYEYLIPLEDGIEIYKKCDAKLEKKRTTFKRGKETYDIDTYPNGITAVEVEFQSLKDAKKWVKPHWIGEEITGNSKYSNIQLAKQNLKF